jgi:hypothetical protein
VLSLPWKLDLMNPYEVQPYFERPNPIYQVEKKKGVVTQVMVAAMKQKLY